MALAVLAFSLAFAATASRAGDPTPEAKTAVEATISAEEANTRVTKDPNASAPSVAPAAQTPEPEPLDEFFAALWPDVEAAGISRDLYKQATADLTVDPRIVELLHDQPEHARAIWDYLGFAVSEKRIADGREKLTAEKPILEALEGLYGVDRNILLAIWGLETGYGTNLGTRSVIRSLATLAAKGGYRAKFGREQLLAAFDILKRGDTTPEGLVGSWAGAMGHTQFIPTTFNAYAVDADGDGKRDIWGSLADALGSAANYLRASGWQSGEPWGHEAVLPKGFDFALAGRRKKKPLSEWVELGITRADGKPLKNLERDAALILPAGAGGPAFLIFKNFNVILRYNQAISYALAIGYLADRIGGAEPFKQAWPVHLRPLNRSQREEIQALLVARGLATGGIDGIVGPATRQALRTFQSEQGLAADGFPSVSLLERLRRATSQTPEKKLSGTPDQG